MTAPAVPFEQPQGDPPPRRNRAAKKIVNQLLWYASAIILALFIFFPILLIFVSATTPDSATYAYPKSVIPVGISTGNIETFLRAAGVIDAFWRSVIAGIITVALALGIGAPAGYAIARYAFRGRNGYRLGVLATRAFPIVILSIPLAVMYRQIGIFDTVWGVALMHTALALPFGGEQTDRRRYSSVLKEGSDCDVGGRRASRDSRPHSRRGHPLEGSPGSGGHAPERVVSHQALSQSRCVLPRY